jgi:hypothetical protein
VTASEAALIAVGALVLLVAVCGLLGMLAL